MAKDDLKFARRRRHARIRARLKGTPDRPRLSVFRSLNHIYAQVIDDSRGETLVAASTLDPEISKETADQNRTSVSGQVGSLLAKRALGQGIVQVAFDRGGNRYHGRVKALAEAARQAGLKF